MILFKLLLIPLFLLTVFVIIYISKVLYKLIDAMEVDETKNDIKYQAELVDDVKEYVDTHADEIEKASSEIVKDFVNK